MPTPRHTLITRAVAGLGAAALGLTFTLTPHLHLGGLARAAETCPADKRNLLPAAGGRYYLSGVNVPWQSGGYGADFATIEEWGQHTYSSAATEQMFAELAGKGVNSVRWWVFADGRGAPEFDSTSGGSVTGFDATTLPSIADAARLAAKYNLRLVLTLWSFDMFEADSTPSAKGEHAGGHRDLVVDAAKRRSFIEKALIPMLKYPVAGTSYTLGTHPGIYGWEVINEPEYAISEIGQPQPGIPQQVALADMQRFVAEVAGAIHRNSSQTVTVGSAAMKWNSDAGLGTQGNWWKDSALKPYDPDGYLDYYQIHYYGWMNGDGVSWSYSPLQVGWQAGGFDKPVVVGEHPANAGGTGLGVGAMLSGYLGNCYGGAWAWSYAPVDGNGSWSDLAGPMAQFNSANAALVRIPAAGAPAPTATSVPPTATATRVPATAVPPTATATRVPATATTTRVPATAVPPTATATRVPATATTTRVPVTATATRVPPTATRVPPTATRAPATATPAGAAPRTIYADGLASGWANWSWSTTVNAAYKSLYKVGGASMQVQHTAAWGGLYLHTDAPVATTGLSKLSFWVHGGTAGGQPLRLYIRNGSGQISAVVALPKPTAGAWTRVDVPLSQLGSPSAIAEIFIQENGGAARPAYYVDDIRLVP